MATSSIHLFSTIIKYLKFRTCLWNSCLLQHKQQAYLAFEIERPYFCFSKGLHFSQIWIKGPQLTDRDYLNDTNNEEYKHPSKALDCKIGQYFVQIWKGSTNQMLGFRIFQIMTICGPLNHIAVVFSLFEFNSYQIFILTVNNLFVMVNHKINR